MLPAPLNRLPPGLLDLLGIRSAGRNPQTLLEQLQPQINLTDWYKQTARVDVRGSGPLLNVTTNSGFISIATTAPVNLANMECPSNEVWIALPGSMVGWDINAVAAITIDATLVSRNVTAQRFNAWPMLPFGYRNGDAAIVRSGGMSLSRELWILPGDRVQILLQGFGAGVGGTAQLYVQLNLVRMRI